MEFRFSHLAINPLLSIYTFCPYQALFIELCNRFMDRDLTGYHFHFWFMFNMKVLISLCCLHCHLVSLSYSQWSLISMNFSTWFFLEWFCSSLKLNHFFLGICVYKIQIPYSFEIIDTLNDFSDRISTTAPLLTAW